MKAKGGKKFSKSEQVYAKKSKTITRKENPFELHVNREKFNVLNRKTHHSFGKPLVSRQNAFERRKQTIGAGYKDKNKSNQFEDRSKSTYKKPPKESIYNLNDTEKLTHRGQTLEEIEQFDDVLPDEDDEISDEELRLDANYTKAAHFGGGNEDEKDRKTAIDELIADSKKRKAERMKEHEEMLDLTNKLDNDWKDLISVIKVMERTETPDKPEPDEYDRLVKEMIFAPRGEPTQKLKSEEELARIEKEKLDNLEVLRQLRMNGEEEVVEKKSNYRSADDLDDGYFLEPVMDDENDRVLSYPIEPEEEVNGGDEELAESGSENDSNNEEIAENEESGAEEDSGQEGASEESESESEVDSLEDLKGDESDSDSQESESEENVLKESKNKKLKSPVEPMDHIPFTIALPDDYEKFLELLGNQSIKIQFTIVERIIKTNHPKLHFSNKNKMLKLFTFLLQYINDIFSSSDESNISKHFKLAQKFGPLLFDMVQMNPEDCSKSFLEVVKEKYEDYKKTQKSYPKLDTIIFFRFLDVLFPTSDFRHPVVTPCYIFLHHILSQSKVKTKSDVTSGLFLATLALDYQKISKRFLPAVLNFLKGICYMGVKKSMLESTRPVPPFKKMDELLVLDEAVSSVPGKMTSKDLVTNDVDDDFKVRALNTAVCLISDYIKLYEDLVGVRYLIDSFEPFLSRLSDEEKLPAELLTSIKSTLEYFDKVKCEKSFKYPEPEKKLLPMLRMLEPRFEAVHTDRRQMYCQSSGQAAEKKKLQHMLKREKKALKRDLIRDNEFLTKIKHKRKQQMDTERKEKVKRILHEGNVQQSEFKALSRTKGRKAKF